MFFLKESLTLTLYPPWKLGNWCVYFYGQKNIPKPKPILPSLHLSHGTSVFRASSRSSPRAKRWPNCESANSWMAACVHTWPWSKSANHSRKKHGASVVPSCFFSVFFWFSGVAFFRVCGLRATWARRNPTCNCSYLAGLGGTWSQLRLPKLKSHMHRWKLGHMFKLF